ncbi:hypothetical protein [Pedobacter frigiditerrae]|uniref:hypothetical protein n=1 Tax=Pedobacter frigiditerrae TaxID=2530452 RepID=UPI00293026A6|nr:hypothetical protein [Pedobacter frigiditerrae]
MDNFLNANSSEEAIKNVNSQKVNYPISGVKVEKLGMFMPYFGENTQEFIFKCSGRGDNSWKKVASRIHLLDIADAEQTSYNNRLYDEFELNRDYDTPTIIKIVSTVRRDLGLPIGEQTSKWYADQICNLFLTEKMLDTNVGYSKIIGYVLLFKLSPKAHS